MVSITDIDYEHEKHFSRIFDNLEYFLDKTKSELPKYKLLKALGVADIEEIPALLKVSPELELPKEFKLKGTIIFYNGKEVK